MPISTFLNGGTVSQLRGLQWLAFTDTGTIRTRVVTGDSGGGGTTSWSTTGTVACRIDPVADRHSSSTTGGRIDERSTHLVTLSAGAAVSADSQFAIAGRGTFEITASHTRTGGLTQVFEVIEAS